MRKVFIAAAFVAVSLACWMAHSEAEMCECMAETMQSSMMDEMHHKRMEMMGGKHGAGMEGEGPVWRSLMGLDLNEQQMESLKAVRSRAMKEAIRKGADMSIAHMEQKDLLDKDPVDMKAVEAKVRQIEALRSDMHLLHIKARQEIKSILNPEQRKKFKEILEKGHRMGGMGRMHGHDCGMMGGEERHTRGEMMHHGCMEGKMSLPLEKKEGETPAGHKHH